ncbi:hypothetical protein FACS18948_6600 [Clostridia bacterium]|nr:hypothetical protein FACS18948_6600 [Clostridia bacterium]
MAVNDTIQTLFPNAAQAERIAVALENMVEHSDSQSDNVILAMLNETNYKTIMKLWFESNGSSGMTDLSALCDRWYTLTRTGWDGGVAFNDPAVSSISTGTATGDNVGLVCVPSTNALANQDDYAGKPLFAIADCNWMLDDSGEPHITSISGISSAIPFERSNPARFVGVLQMSGWCKYSESAGISYTWTYTDNIGESGYHPLSEAVRMDGTVRAWVVHAKYLAGDDFGCYSGVPPRPWDVSHNSVITSYHNAWGARYCGKTSADESFLKMMWFIKYKSLTMDDTLKGCISYQFTNYKPAVAETGVQRVLLTTAQGATLLVGSTVCLGTAAYTSKASQASVVDRKKIVSIQTVNVSGTDYSAVNIDNGGATFDTTTAQFLTTMHWYTGACDNVKGNDGSPTSATSGKEPAKLQGIEFIVGGYEIISDCIMNYTNNGTTSYVTPHVCRDATKLATSITADYTACNYNCACPAANGWQYHKRLGYDPNRPEVSFATLTGGSSSTYYKDGTYLRGGETLTGAYEWLSGGALTGGASAGLSCADADDALSNAGWYFLSRLSATGNRGEWTA